MLGIGDHINFAITSLLIEYITSGAIIKINKSSGTSFDVDVHFRSVPSLKLVPALNIIPALKLVQAKRLVQAL